MAVNYVSLVEMTHFDTFTLNPAIYQPIDTIGLDAACTVVRLVNDSDASVLISLDGIVNHDYLRAGDNIIFNFQLNSQCNGYVSKIRKRAKIYVKGTAPKFGGYIYLIGYYNHVS